MDKYNKTTWIDGVTELSAENMNKLEAQVEALTNEILDSKGVSDRYRHCISFTDKDTNYSFSLVLENTSSKKMSFQDCVNATLDKGFYKAYGKIFNSVKSIIGRFDNWFAETLDNGDVLVSVQYTYYDELTAKAEYEMPMYNRELSYFITSTSNEEPLFANDIVSAI